MSDSNEITILFFSLFRDLAGTEKMSLSLSTEDRSLDDIVERVYAEVPGLKKWDGQMLLAVNHEYADRLQEIQPGDEIAMMPPVQGG